MPTNAFISAIPLLLAINALGFNIDANTNLAVYWGQNSYGATHSSDTANWQKNIGFYCGSDSVIDTFPIAFLDVFFGDGGVPSINLANTCNDVDNATFPGTDLPNCQSLSSDIETCQAAGKIVTLSLGGASGSATFTSDAQAQSFATQIWNLFLGGSSPTRPFGSAILDGVDLDIEGGGSTGLAAFVAQIRELAAGAGKTYYVTGAPQCVFPDAYLGSVIDAVGFDALYVQFYNNFCGLQNFNNPNAWNFATWDTWAHTVSPNPSIKIYIGAPASTTAAGSGYVDAATFASIIQDTKDTYSSFGGVMLWDASQAYANGRYDISVKNALTSGSSAPPPPPSSPSSSPSSPTHSSTSTTSSAPTSAPTAGSCAGVAAWNSQIAYVGGAEVTYAGDLWTAKWWSEADVPGGAAGDWTNDGACTNINIDGQPIPIPTPIPPSPPNIGPFGPIASAPITQVEPPVGAEFGDGSSWVIAHPGSGSGSSGSGSFGSGSSGSGGSGNVKSRFWSF